MSWSVREREGPSLSGWPFLFVPSVALLPRHLLRLRFTITPEQTGFTRDSLLTELRRHGFHEFETCDSMRPLHTYPAFTDPRSPVTNYRSRCVRSGMPIAARLAASTLRIPVPADDSPASRALIDNATTALNAALTGPSATTFSP